MIAIVNVQTFLKQNNVLLHFCRKQIEELQSQYEKTLEDKEFLEARIEQRGMQVIKKEICSLRKRWSYTSWNWSGKQTFTWSNLL